jgi:hypothetical protein
MVDQLSPRPMRTSDRFKAWRHVDRSDLYSGLFFIGVAVFGLVTSRNFDVGSAANMGEGYIPRLICWILFVIGALIAGRAFLRPSSEAGEPMAWRPIVFVLVSIIVFALTVEKLGLVIAIPLLIGLGSLAGRNLRPFEVVVIAAVLSLGTIAIFSWGLGLTIPVLPRF